jgi:hypothetical protein
MANPYPPEQRLPVVTVPRVADPPMPASATGILFLLASGFGIGALVVLAGFVFLVGIGDLGHNANSSPATPAAQSAANAPAAPGPTPKPAPNTSGAAVPETTGQTPAPADAKTPRAPTEQQQQK